MSNILLLDTTLRDGGLGLEDSYSKGYFDYSFTKEKIVKISELLTNAKIELIELGSIEISNDDKTRFAIYQNIEEISKLIPKNKTQTVKYAALYRGPDTPIQDIPNWNPDLCEFVRVILRYSELEKSVDFCKNLSEKGYKVCVQPMLTMRYSQTQLDYIIEHANQMNAYALYFVDSYGYMQEENIKYFYNLYNEKLNKNIKIGFHAHNNMNLAFSNVKNFILQQDSYRDIIVDSCVMGLGQGAGNMQTEIISDYLIKNFNKKYRYNYILDTAEIIDEFFNKNICGYSLPYLISAINKVAYKYSIDLRYKYGFRYSEIHKILSNISEELRQRYTPENLNLLIKNFRENYHDKPEECEC